MKRIISSNLSLILFSIPSAVFALITVFVLINIAKSVINSDFSNLPMLIFNLCGFGAFSVIFLISLNRMACVILFEDGTVKRKGLLWGFKKECKTCEIQKVIIRYMPREGCFICLIESNTHSFDRARHDSYICFKNTKANRAFLQTFWNGEIEQ